MTFCSVYCYSSVQYTQHLRVVTNDKLRQLLGKGPNYREARTINFSKCKEEIKSALCINIESVAVKYDLTPEQLNPWKNKVLQLLIVESKF